MSFSAETSDFQPYEEVSEACVQVMTAMGSIRSARAWSPKEVTVSAAAVRSLKSQRAFNANELELDRALNRRFA